MNSVALRQMCGRAAVGNDASRHSSCSLTAISLTKMRVLLPSAGVANGAANATTQAIIPNRKQPATVLAPVQGKALSRRPSGRPGPPLRAAAASKPVGMKEWHPAVEQRNGCFLAARR